MFGDVRWFANVSSYHETLLQVTTFVDESFSQIKILKLETKFAFFHLLITSFSRNSLNLVKPSVIKLEDNLLLIFWIKKLHPVCLISI